MSMDEKRCAWPKNARTKICKTQVVQHIVLARFPPAGMLTHCWLISGCAVPILVRSRLRQLTSRPNPWAIPRCCSPFPSRSSCPILGQGQRGPATARGGPQQPRPRSQATLRARSYNSLSTPLVLGSTSRTPKIPAPPSVDTHFSFQRGVAGSCQF